MAQNFMSVGETETTAHDVAEQFTDFRVHAIAIAGARKHAVAGL
jgi:hypothetical protein